jgi:hypothetical protein
MSSPLQRHIGYPALFLAFTTLTCALCLYSETAVAQAGSSHKMTFDGCMESYCRSAERACAASQCKPLVSGCGAVCLDLYTATNSPCVALCGDIASSAGDAGAYADSALQCMVNCQAGGSSGKACAEDCRKKSKPLLEGKKQEDDVSSAEDLAPGEIPIHIDYLEGGGEAYIRRSGSDKWEKLTKTMSGKLRNGDVIKTGKDTRMAVASYITNPDTCEEDVIARLAPDTEIVIDTSKGGRISTGKGVTLVRGTLEVSLNTRLALGVGNCRANTSKRQDTTTEFEVKTPMTTVSVRG